MKKILIIVLFLLNSLVVLAGEQTWITDNIEGKILVTPEYIITISDFDVIDSQLWAPGDDIIIINDDYVVNTDNGEKVEIDYIKLR